MTPAVYESIKSATVAIALFHPSTPGSKNRPFTIVGSGFCIHAAGIVVTCEHVFRTFIDPVVYDGIVRDQSDESRSLSGIRPHVIFYNSKPVGQNVIAFPIPIVNAVTKTDFDLAVFRLSNHKAFKNGYPTVPIAKYEDVYETMEVATCGFPLGEQLEEQLGTVTSSFTSGIISSIIPTSGVDRENLRGFQLDLTATNGNSGGPVFSLVTGEVFGVLQAGVMHPQSGHAVQGLTKAEPIYPVLSNQLVERLLE